MPTDPLTFDEHWGFVSPFAPGRPLEDHSPGDRDDGMAERWSKEWRIIDGLPALVPDQWVGRNTDGKFARLPTGTEAINIKTGKRVTV